jgi:transketolase
MTLYGDALFLLQIHGIQHLCSHVTAVDGIGKFEQSVGQSALSVIYMCNDAEIPNVFHLYLLPKRKDNDYLCFLISFRTMNDIHTYQKIASQVRRDILRMVTGAGSGHPGGSMSSADILTALYFKELNVAPESWNRAGTGHDMFFLSIGHVSPLFYSVLARRGFFPVSELGTFRVYGSRLQGHPSIEAGLPGVHQASGSLGQGLSVAIGAALSKRLAGDKSRVFVLIGDGESQEGQIWEAAAAAVHHKVDNLIAMTDWNHQQIDGTTEEVQSLGDLTLKWNAFGWECIVANGHDFNSIFEAFGRADSLLGGGRPVMILFETEMGHGVDFMTGTCEWHGKSPSKEQCERGLAQLEETLGDY